MKIIPQCDHYSERWGYSRIYHIITRFGIWDKLLCANKGISQKIVLSHETQEKAIFPSRKLQKANLRGEYLPTISKTVFSIPPGYWNIFRIMKVPFQIQLQCVINAKILMVCASENLILAYL